MYQIQIKLLGELTELAEFLRGHFGRGGQNIRKKRGESEEGREEKGQEEGSGVTEKAGREESGPPSFTS